MGRDHIEDTRMVDRVVSLATGWVAFTIALIWLALFVNSEPAARLQGEIWPVVTPLQVDTVSPFAMLDGTPATRISGTAVKLRDCNFRTTRWYIEDADGRDTRVNAYFLDPPLIRQPGVLTWDALIVGVTPEMLSTSRAEVHHECQRLPVVSFYYRGDMRD